MKYAQYTVVFQEVPDEVTLLFEITNCPWRCSHCHSPHLQADIGDVLSMDKFVEIFTRYEGLVSNVAFFGGEQHEIELLPMLDYVRAHGVKTTLWTGADCVSDAVLARLNYLKTGQYDPKRGDLKSPTTNQKYVNLDTGKRVEV